MRANRLQPFVRIFLALAVLGAVVNASLEQLAATPVLGWLPNAVSGPGYLEDNRSRVAGALEEYGSGAVSDADHLVALIGISNVREGIDLKLLAASAGEHSRVLGIGGAGLGMPDVAHHADAVLDSPLRPDLVVLGFALHQLVDTRPKPHALNLGWREYARRGDFHNMASSIRGSLWVYARRQDVSLATESALLDARAWLFKAFDVRLPQAEDNRRSPWRDMLKSGWPDHFSSATLREEDQFLTDLGVFDAATYAHSPKAMAALIRTSEQFRARRAKVVLVLMPSHPSIQSRIPAAARAELDAALQHAFPGDPPAVVDLQRAVDAEGFVDLTHPNHSGSVILSRLVGEAIRQQIPAGPSLMSAHP